MKKSASQETVISLMGLLVGSLMVSNIKSPFATWSSLIALLSIHICTNFLAVRAVSMTTLNRQRANIIFSTYLGSSTPHRIPTPSEVSAVEKVFERDGVLRWRGGPVIGWCNIGVRLSDILCTIAVVNRSTNSYRDIEDGFQQRLLATYRDEEYILWYDAAARTHLVVLKEGCNTLTQLRAWLHALLLARQITVRGIQNNKTSFMSTKDTLALLQETHSKARQSMLEMLPGLRQAGWNVDVGALETTSTTRLSNNIV